MQISEFFKNKAGQFSIDELLKILAGVAGVVLGCIFFFTSIIAIEKASYVMVVEGVLWAYALGQGMVGNITKE